ncbi:MAG: hypothetical protein AAFU38_15730, partial [Bacteroidota bacterium]
RLVDALAVAGLLVEEHRAAGVVTYRLAESAHATSGDGQASDVPTVGAQAASTQARSMVFDESRDRPMFVRAAQALQFEVLDAQIVEVTPALASEWLTHNTRNRPLRRSTMRRYARLMQRGRWLVGTDGVGFCVHDGQPQLVNGQHRLTAVAESETAQLMVVVTGLTPEVFQVLDAGQARSAADALAVEGFSNASTLAAACRLALFLSLDAERIPGTTQPEVDGRAAVWDWRGAASGRVESDTVVRVARETSPLLPACAAWADNRTHHTKRLFHKSQLAFVRWAIHHKHPAPTNGDAGVSDEGGEAVDHAHFAAVRDACDRALDRAVTGIGFADLTDPMYQLRQAMDEDAHATGDRLDPQQKLAMLITATNAAIRLALDRRDVPPRSIKVGRDKPFPKPLGW